MTGRLAGAALAAALLTTPAAQADQPGSGELLRRIEHLRVVGSVLYVAAHPDDENTRLIAWLVGERGLETTYLSLTRGGGGQNLIGAEQADLLGVVRTGELLAARRIDGADQAFTRARDFGYSKSAEEALAIWGHDEVLRDVVRVLRQVRPDVVVTRFASTDPTHGHHVASAILTEEAFVLAADPAYVVDGLLPWQADRLVRNQSSWRIDDSTDTSDWLSLDVGGYDPLTGRSWGEIAADSRTMHKSQGFGSAPSVGPQREYFAALAGDVPAPGEDLFSGLDLGWSRVEGTAALDRALARAADRFDPRAPHDVLPDLARAHALLGGVDAGPWGPARKAEIEEVMAAAAGLWLTARSDAPAVSPGGEIAVDLTALVRSAAEGVVLHEVRLEPGGVAGGGPLASHAPWGATATLTVPSDTPLSRPPWLVEPPTDALYTVADGPGRVAADAPASLVAAFDVTIAGRRMTLRRPVQYAWVDPVDGERAHDVEVLPPVTATFGQRARFVPAGQTVEVAVTLRADTGPARGVLRLTAPEGGSVTPDEIPFALGPDAPEQVVAVRVSAGAGRGALTASVDVEGERFGLSRAVIDYGHLPRRTVLRPASLDVVPVTLDRGGVERVAYLPGSGDEVDDVLRDLGYRVDVVDEAVVAGGGLADYDAVVLGIRAFNTRPRLLDLDEALGAYVAGGGRLIVQYNTSSARDLLPAFAPAPLSIGRGRVTDETAPLVPVDPDAALLHAPNALTADDAAGWVQERGLYFAETWDPSYEPVFRTSDPGEAPLEGALLVLGHGEGVFVYTGLSFFRQLPAGVPGAARLLANLLALEPR